MEKIKNNLLEDSECIAMVVGFVTSIGLLALPNAVVQDAKQDGWISVVVGGVYPLFLAFLSIYYVKKHPNEDILVLSKKYLGVILGTICNILFMAQFGIYLIGVASGMSNVYICHATTFLTPIKIFIPAILVATYLALKEIKVLARINMIGLYAVVILILTLLPALQRGNYLNLFPVFGSGYKNILKASLESAYAYGGLEGIFLIYPFMRNKDKIKAVVFKSCFLIMSLYIWTTFICIYFFGYKVTSKALWPVLLVTEGVNLPVLNSFRFIFLFLWSLAIFRTLANFQYLITYIVSYILKVKDKKKIYWFTVPIAIYLCLKVGNEVQRRAILGYIIPTVTLFNIAYVSVIAILIFIKDKGQKQTTT
ncbi:spore germination protein [Clostridium estertheticum]|uniref:GerAB/ArcD/ProY family transporter n=1 Tax=Clostridium estertheticum TaxID=238834 RepID=UPI0013E90A79|nr:endospore germination permease [Clostridium estertheticum]MBZ9686198.1 spore germination protein [Clostridium estertheticum]